MYHSILVPLDLSPLSEQALPVALSLARRSNATLQLAYVADSHSALYDTIEAQARAYLEAWAERLRVAGCQATIAVLLNSCDTDETLPRARLIAMVLHNHALATGADLVAMTTHSRSEVARLWLGSVADSLVRELSLPILLIRPQQPVPDLGHEYAFSHVLVPLDGSPQAESVLDYAMPLILLMGARCTLIQAIDPLLAGHTIPPYTVGLTKQEAKQLQAHARAYLARIAKRLRTQSARVQTHVVVAEPAEAIITYAHEHAVDLITMATHGRHLLSQLFLGSTATKVIHTTRAPVLVYRPSPELASQHAATSEQAAAARAPAACAL